MNHDKYNVCSFHFSSEKLHDFTKKTKIFPTLLFPSQDSFSSWFHVTLAKNNVLFFFWCHCSRLLLPLSCHTFSEKSFRLHSSPDQIHMPRTNDQSEWDTGAKMKCKYWKQLHGTMGLLNVLQLLFAFVMVVVCHYLWCDSICLADWIKRMAREKRKKDKGERREIARLNYECCTWNLGIIFAIRICIEIKWCEKFFFHNQNNNHICHNLSSFHISLCFSEFGSVCLMLINFACKPNQNKKI